MKRIHTIEHAGVAVAALLATLAAGAGARGEGPMPVPTSVREADRGVAAGVNAFAFDLYARLRGGEGNLFLSPYSIATALAMTSAGARGETDREIAAVLHVAEDPPARHAAFRGLIAHVNGEGAASPRLDTLDSANALWLQKGEAFLPAFLETTRTDYAAAAFDVDFAGDASGARAAINDWVAGQTRRKIRDIIGPSDLDRDTALVLTNAIYYKGAWAHPFNERLTQKEADFTAGGGRTVKVPMMAQVASFRYHDGATFAALELPYVGGARSMLVLLPRSADGLPALEAALDAKALDGVVGALARRRVDLKLPRFRLEESFQLADVLAALGMARAFDPDRADFSGMTGKRDRAISKVIHKAFVDVTEAGTEAAAATAVVMTRAMAALPESPVVFHADHPFLFLIRDQQTGAVLFLGRYRGPSR